MRLHDLDRGERAWTIAAGLPIYVSLFGRDTLTASWQAAILGPEMMQGTLPELARWQGTEDNPWRDEQRGKMLHEAHTGPLAKLQCNPRDLYYGAITTSAFYPVVISELWHWTGDKQMVGPLIESALKAIAWSDKYADLRGDGFRCNKCEATVFAAIKKSCAGERSSGNIDGASYGVVTFPATMV